MKTLFKLIDEYPVHFIVGVWIFCIILFLIEILTNGSC